MTSEPARALNRQAACQRPTLPDALRLDLIPPGSRVLCAVSGGADSMCLLHLLRGVPDIAVVCAHFNHMLRDAESDRDEAFVRNHCRSSGIVFLCGCGDVAALAVSNGMSIEEAARDARYAFLYRAAAESGCTCIALAHNAEDNAETMLENLTRGAGTAGLAGIPPVRGMLVRPLLGVSRAEILNYNRANGVDWIEDSSNAGDEYFRNRLRHHVWPVLQARNPRAADAFSRAAAHLRADDEYLCALADGFIAANRTPEGALPCSALRDLAAPVRERVWRALLPRTPATVHTDALDSLCAAPAGDAELYVPGTRVYRRGGLLWFGMPPAALPPMPRTPLRPGQSIAVEALAMRIVCTEQTDPHQIHNSFTTFCFNCEKICGTIYAAGRTAGAKIALEGRGCTKTLRQLYREGGIPPALRETLPVIFDDLGPIAVPLFGVAARCAARPGSRYIKICLMNGDGTQPWKKTF